MAPGARPSRHAVLASTSLVLFWPLGIPAVIAAFGVDEALLWGDLERARARSRRALVFGALGVVAWVALAGVFMAAAFWAVTSLLPVALGAVTVEGPQGLLSPGGSLVDVGDLLPLLGGYVEGSDAQPGSVELEELLRQLEGTG